MATQTAPKIDELVDQVNALLDQPRRDDMAVARLKGEAKRISDAEPAGSHVLLGMLAALEQNPESSRAEFEIALRISNRNPRVLDNFAVALQRLGYFTESRTIAEEAYKPMRGALDLLDHLIHSCFVACRVDLAADWLIEWCRLNPGETHPLEADIEAIARFFRSHRIRPTDVEHLLGLSIETLRNSHVFVVEMREALAADEDSEWFSVQLGVEESVERVVHLNIALAERLAALRLPAAIGNHTSFTYVPAA